MNLNKFVITDIHGCLHSLKELLDTIGLSKEDEIYFLGDYVDRGPYSKEVIRHYSTRNYKVHLK
ncbi:MAG: metallophosphoesterase [Bacteroidota bacterium]